MICFGGCVFKSKHVNCSYIKEVRSKIMTVIRLECCCELYIAQFKFSWGFFFRTFQLYCPVLNICQKRNQTVIKCNKMQYIHFLSFSLALLICCLVPGRQEGIKQESIPFHMTGTIDILLI